MTAKKMSVRNKEKIFTKSSNTSTRPKEIRDSPALAHVQNMRP